MTSSKKKKKSYSKQKTAKKCKLKFTKLKKRWYEKVSADEILAPYEEVLQVWNELSPEKREKFLRHSPNFAKLYETFKGLE